AGAKEGPATSATDLIVVFGSAIEASLAHDSCGSAPIRPDAKPAVSTRAVSEAETKRRFIAVILSGRPFAPETVDTSRWVLGKRGRSLIELVGFRHGRFSPTATITRLVAGSGVTRIPPLVELPQAAV